MSKRRVSLGGSDDALEAVLPDRRRCRRLPVMMAFTSPLTASISSSGKGSSRAQINSAVFCNRIRSSSKKMFASGRWFGSRTTLRLISGSPGGGSISDQLSRCQRIVQRWPWEARRAAKARRQTRSPFSLLLSRNSHPSFSNRKTGRRFYR